LRGLMVTFLLVRTLFHANANCFEIGKQTSEPIGSERGDHASFGRPSAAAVALRW
jgi:hypothetical protein